MTVSVPSSVSLFQVDAFIDPSSSQPFSGNPAAVCPLEQWLPDELMQAIAAENNLSETAFFVPAGRGYHIRWFTPTTEVDLCGHATLASAHVLFNELNYANNTILFTCRSGALAVSREEDQLVLDLPRQTPTHGETPDGLAEALGATPTLCVHSDDLVASFDDVETILELAPDMRALAKLPYRGIIVTAPGEDCDFVCRFFAPAYGIDEDPVTGSAYTKLAPFWEEQLHKNPLSARQLSARGGVVSCRVKGNRVLLSGQARLVIRGELLLPRAC